MQAQVVMQVRSMKDYVAALECNDKSVYEVNTFIHSLIDLIGKTEKPSDFLYQAFKHDMIDDLNLLTEKHLKQYWHHKSDQERSRLFRFIQSELIYSMVLLQMNLEQY